MSYLIGFLVFVIGSLYWTGFKLIMIYLQSLYVYQPEFHKSFSKLTVVEQNYIWKSIAIVWPFFVFNALRGSKKQLEKIKNQGYKSTKGDKNGK